MLQHAVSVVIRCWNEGRRIGRLLDGLASQTVDAEVIVVDSGSTDDTLDIVARYPAKVVHISPERFSFGRALNLGLSATTSDIAVMASAHVYPVYEDWLARLIAPFDDPEVAAVYGKQRGSSETRFSEHRVFAHWYPDESDYARPNPFCNNANCAVRRELWCQAPYNEELPGLEDIDWAKRVAALGYRVTYEAEAEIVHVHDETARQVYRRYFREGRRRCRSTQGPAD